MNRRRLFAAVLFFLLFAAATLVRTAPWQAPEPDAEGVREAAEKERIRRFWSLHREAGRHRTAGAYDEAIRLYEAALRLDGEHEDALYYVSNMYLEVGRLQDAERTLDQLLRLHPTSSRGYSRLGDVHLCFADPALFDPGRAHAAYRKAASLNREETGPLLRLAQVALVDGRLDEARRLLDAVVGTNARSIEGHYFAGFVAWKQGDVPAAGGRYEQAWQLAHGDTPKERVMGEGDRKPGTAIKPGEQLSCPTMLQLLQDVAGARRPPHEAYRGMDRTLARLRTRSHP